ncbi:putative RNA-directed DNA polymerase [Helianthus anomalus]
MSFESYVAVWEGQSLPFERVAWLRFLGVPLHLVDPDVLTMVGKEFGKVLHVQKSFGEDKDLSVVRVGVLAGDVERIKEFVSVRWKDRSYRIWVEEELDIWVPDCLGVKGGVSPADSSPMASSPVGHPKEQGSSREFHVEDEEFCMGEGEDSVEEQVFSLSKNIGVGVVPNEVNINWQSFLEPCDGNVPNNSGNRRTGIHFFKAGRKSKKLKRGGPNGPAVSFSGSPNGLVDSTEKGRPKKRNRAQEVENSDPFSLDYLFDLMKSRGENGGAGQPAANYVNLNRPLDSDGAPIDINVGVAGEVSSQSCGHRCGEALDPGIQPFDGIQRKERDVVDQEVSATVNLGVKLGMDVGNCEELVRKEIMGKGLGGEEKARWVKGLKVKFGISFMAFQETKCSASDDKVIARFWGSKEFGVEWVDSRGLSGGLVSVWDKKMFDFCSSSKDRNFLIVNGKIKGSGLQINIANIYAPQDIRDKKILWDHLLGLIDASSGLWIFLGDFNAVRTPEERLNTRFNSSCAGNFNSFIYDARLMEYVMKDRKYTRWSDNGRKGSKIDRFLVCPGFFGLWPNACFRALPRLFSDHCPIILVTKESNFGPKPFRVFNSWIGREGFDSTVREAAQSFVGPGPADLYLLKKFEWIRSRVKEWRDVMIKKEGELEANARIEIEELEKLMEVRDLEEEEEWALAENLACIKEVEENKTKDLNQRSRVRWAKEGDENSNFFHSMINVRKASNWIHGLHINGSWCEKPTLIKKKVFEFFRGRFKEEIEERPSLICDRFKRLSEEDANWLVSGFSLDELKSAVWDCGSNRAPGPDGFNFMFLKHFWDVFEGDFLNVLNEFSSSGTVSRGCASSFIALIPKIRDPSDLNDFRPISLVGAINKVISKVLANRLKKVIASVISENQSAFIKGKCILDGPLIISEAVNWLKKKKRKAFLFKLDFEKAYDNVNWGFVDSVMSQMGFPQLWRKWVFGILSSARAAVLVNGSPTFDFQCHKGMRQGDPLSPFLFLLVMEALSACFSKADELGLVEGVRLPNSGPVLSHLLFADDALVIGEWSKANIFNVVRILRCFRICSGLHINLDKSSIIGIGIPDSDLHSMALDIGCKVDQFPLKYLGLPVGANMNRISNWSPVIGMFESRLALWKASVLSIGGRVTLIKSVLQSLPIYFFSLFKVPAGVISQLEAIMRKFLWGGSGEGRRMSWVSWDCVTSPINSGGLGIRKLGQVNKALLSKWAWRFKTDRGSLWAKVISAIHMHCRSWDFLPFSSSLGGIWGSIVKTVERPFMGSDRIRHFFKGEVGDGRMVAFWLDPWLCKDPLRNCFPNLFGLEIEKRCCVRDRIVSPFSNPSANWRWKRAPDENVELAEWAALCSLLRDVVLSDRCDQWRWLAGVSGW